MFLDLLKQAESRQYPLCVAEIGAKYAELDVMRQMIRSAAECGADLVKFQTYQAETVATRDSYFTLGNGARVSQYDFFKKYELTRDDHRELIDCCRQIGIGWLSTPSHPSDVDLLEEFDPPCYKTGSDDLTNLPLLEYIARKKRPMMVSTGMSTLEEVGQAVNSIAGTGNRQLILLHCVTAYPSRVEDANLRAIETLRNAFGFPVGLSDHTQDSFSSILATQLGAVIIEKHFTLSHTLKLQDDEVALDPPAFRKMVENIRLIPLALGSGVKRVLEAETTWRESARKSIHSTRAIMKGEILQAGDIAIRRPSNGIPPQMLGTVIGRKATCDIPEGTPLTWDML